MNFISFVDC